MKMFPAAIGISQWDIQGDTSPNTVVWTPKYIVSFHQTCGSRNYNKLNKVNRYAVRLSLLSILILIIVLWSTTVEVNLVSSLHHLSGKLQSIL